MRTVADAEGLPAVSMRRVTAEFGAGAMSLYRYIPSEAELLPSPRSTPPAPSTTASPPGNSVSKIDEFVASEHFPKNV